MNRTAVASATLATIAYDDARMLLQVEFRSGAVYQYFSVPATVHQALLGASSKSIRGQFPFVRLAAAGAGTHISQQRQEEASWRAR